jgi:transcription initiation factor TFIIIB Brf1 subunit/transcription initiation factor TFIIB
MQPIWYGKIYTRQSLYEAEGRMRTGMPTSLSCSDMGLSTVISRSDNDANGYEIKPSMLSTTA